MVAHRRPYHRHGFTLLEISLVLVILVVISALVAPNFQGTLNNERLRKGTESIAASWTQTRATAMQTGETQVWACEIGGAGYSANVASSNAMGESVANAPGLSGGTAASIAELSETLPAGIEITQAIVSDSDTLTSMQQSTLTNESGRASLFFFPDGTSSNARITLALAEGGDRAMTVMINGLAGTVRVLQSGVSTGARK